MNWTSLAPAIFSLIGVAVGAIGSLLGVYYVQRTARENARLEHWTRIRDQCRNSYVDYVVEVENSWAFLDGLWGKQPIRSVTGEALKGEAIAREAAVRNHAVWYAQQKMALVAPDPVRASASALSSKLYEATYHRDSIDEKLWEYLHPAQEAFLDAARADLDPPTGVEGGRRSMRAPS